jgi:hypothetical protein
MTLRYISFVGGITSALEFDPAKAAHVECNRINQRQIGANVAPILIDWLSGFAYGYC